MTAGNTLPADWKNATMIGRVMLPNVGAAVVYVNGNGDVIDITRSFPLTSDLCEEENPAAAARRAALTGKKIGRIEDIIANSSARDPNKPFLLSPADAQDIEAAGVTFVASMIERMIEQAAMKELAPKDDEAIDKNKLDLIRTRIKAEITGLLGEKFDFATIVPGSPAALEILENIRKKGWDTAYPTVGLKLRGELFSKASPGLSVGHGAQGGYNGAKEAWTNPEPEVVLFVSSKGKIVGATHGNDVNDRRSEGDSALYLHDAKVRKGSTIIGPLVRLFDEKFTLEDVKQTEVSLEVTDADGKLRFKGVNNMKQISRAPERIVAQAMEPSQFRPHGAAIFLGTMTIPLKDASSHPDEKQQDTFTHKEGDVVTMGSPQLGYLTNLMLPAEKVQGLEGGIVAHMRNLASRGLHQAEAPEGTRPQRIHVHGR